MKISSCFFCLICLSAFSLKADHAFRTFPNSIWNTFDKPACLAETERISYGLSVENRFCKELNTISAALILPTSSGLWHSTYSNWGYEDYREHGFSVGLAKKITPNFNASLSFVNTYYRLPRGYPDKFMCYAKISTRHAFSRSFFINTALHIPFRLKKSTISKEPIKNLLQLELYYLFSEQLSLSCYADYTTQYKVSGGLCLYYFPVKAFGLMMNLGLDKQFSFGISHKIKPSIEINLFYSYRQIIGNITNLCISHKL